MKKELQNLKKSLNNLGIKSYANQIDNIIKVSQDFPFDISNINTDREYNSPVAISKRVKELSRKFNSRNYADSKSTIFEEMSLDMATVRKDYELLDESSKKRLTSMLSDEENEFLKMCISVKNYESNFSKESLQRVRQFAAETRRNHIASERKIREEFEKAKQEGASKEDAQNKAMNAAGEYYDKIYDSFYRMSKEDQELVISIAKGTIGSGSEYRVLREYFGKD